MDIHQLFSDADLARLRDAVAAAEANNAGEIVPYLVARADGYAIAHWRGAALGAMLAALIAGMVHLMGDYWWSASLAWISLPTLCGVMLGYVLAYIPSIRRMLLLPDEMNQQVRRRAESAFLEQEVFGTRNRTGVLIFLALFERQALVLADAGINRVVDQRAWQALVDELVEGIGQGRAADALCQAIAHCGEVLNTHRVMIEPDDQNEVDNGLRVREQ